MSNGAVIRQHQASDVRAVVELLGELACDVTYEDGQKRMLRLMTSPTDRILVAEVAGEVVGLLSVHISPLLHRDVSARITAFIVTAARQGQGIGSAMLREAEAWALASGCCQIEVTSGDHHAAAHGFYEHHGYRLDDRRFVKEDFD